MRMGNATFSLTTGFAAGVSSCCTSCGNPEIPGKMNSAAIARFLMVLFMGWVLSLRCLFDLFYTPNTNETGKGYKENYDFFLCATSASSIWQKHHILATKERHKDNSGHWHDAEVKVHGDKLVITYEDEDA